MKRILLLILICCHLLPATAQKNAPKWMDKSKKAVVLITTYGKDGAKLTSGTGIFVSETGDVLSAQLPAISGNKSKLVVVFVSFLFSCYQICRQM